MSQIIPVPAALGWERKTKEADSVLKDSLYLTFTLNQRTLIEEIMMTFRVSMKTDLRVSLSYMGVLQLSFLNFSVNSTVKALQDPSELSIFLHTPRSPWHFRGGPCHNRTSKVHLGLPGRLSSGLCFVCVPCVGLR